MKRRHFFAGLLSLPFLGKLTSVFATKSKHPVPLLKFQDLYDARLNKVRDPFDGSFLVVAKRGSLIRSADNKISFEEDTHGKWLFKPHQPTSTDTDYYIADIKDQYRGFKGVPVNPHSMKVYRVGYNGEDGLLLAAHYVGYEKDMHATYSEFVKAMQFFNVRHAKYELHHWAFCLFAREHGLEDRLVMTYPIAKKDQQVKIYKKGELDKA